jgi:hypothetical protein
LRKNVLKIGSLHIITGYLLSPSGGWFNRFLCLLSSPLLLLCYLSSIPILKYPNCQKAHKSQCTPISAPGISVRQINCKPNKKHKQDPEYPNWKKNTHKLITNPLSKTNTKIKPSIPKLEKKYSQINNKPTHQKKTQNKTLNTQIGKKLTN